jgi:uncharacterized protein (DUF2267 family)
MEVVLELLTSLLALTTAAAATARLRPTAKYCWQHTPVVSQGELRIPGFFTSVQI